MPGPLTTPLPCSETAVQSVTISAAPARCAKYSAMSGVGTLSAVARVRVIADIQIRLGNARPRRPIGVKRSVIASLLLALALWRGSVPAHGPRTRVGHGPKERPSAAGS